MDYADLYDYEIAAIGPVWQKLMTEFSRKPNTRANLQELAKRANDEFIKIGFVVNVRWENNLIVNPSTMQPYPIEIEFVGRVPGANPHNERAGGFDLMDHERKRDEVLKSKDRGEDFLGQKK